MKLEYDFQILTDQLLSIGAICSASELQGMLCGQLAGGKRCENSEWVEQAREFADLTHFELSPEQEALILYILENSQKTLAGDDFAFKPLLPDDACPLADRSRELGAWCLGFLHGFGSSGVTKDTQIPPDVAEVVRDLAQISQAVKAVEEEEDETEADWTELVEYLRAGVFTIYTEMNPPAAPTAESSLVH